MAGRNVAQALASTFPHGLTAVKECVDVMDEHHDTPESDEALQTSGVEEGEIQRLGS